MNNVTVIDSIMGSGKTSWAIQHMNESPANKRFIYITPYLDEASRIQSSVTNRQFFEPDNSNKEGSKLRSLKSLIAYGKDIASTHSLFQSVDEEVIKLLRGSGYTLILDEVMNVVECANIGEKDIGAALESFTRIENSRVIWLDENYKGRFNDVKRLATMGNLFYHRGTLIWTFLPQVFEVFDAIFVMTYLFDAQPQRYYYDLNGITYDYKAVKSTTAGYELTEYD